MTQLGVRTMEHPERLLRHPETLRRIGVSRSTLYRLVRDRHFPRPIRIGRGTMAWPESEITAWIEARKAERTEEGVAGRT